MYSYDRLPYLLFRKSHKAVNQKQVKPHHLNLYVLQKMYLDELEMTVIGK